ncbi:MAG: VOC family protein [Candidatus Tritonobacter lacicola]|nr:VOC family protein [Candidatus Tritonobacter lacicola]
MLEHVGITINEESDIQAFYKDLLGLEEVNKFDLYEDLSEKAFGISNMASVTFLSRDNFFIELFLTGKKQSPVYNHICISIHDRDNVIRKAKSKGFPVTNIKRESKDDVIFLKDNSGNIFEIKEARGAP